MFVMEGNSAPQCRAIVQGIRRDVKGWTTMYQGEGEEGEKWEGSEGLPSHLRKKITLTNLTPTETLEWSRLKTLPPGGVEPYKGNTGGTGSGTRVRNSSNVYQSGWVVLDYGDVVVNVIDRKSVV